MILIAAVRQCSTSILFPFFSFRDVHAEKSVHVINWKVTVYFQQCHSTIWTYIYLSLKLSIIKHYFYLSADNLIRSFYIFVGSKELEITFLVSFKVIRDTVLGRIPKKGLLRLSKIAGNYIYECLLIGVWVP